MAAPAEWLTRTVEDTLEPDLPICDPHHHLWDHGPEDRYLFDDVLKDVGGGHRIVSTVFVDCRSMYRAGGPPELKPVGETEFVQGIAAMSASGQYGPTRIAAGIVSYADLRLGARVAPVLEAHIAASPNRFRGIRYSTTWHEHGKELGLHFRSPPGLMMDNAWREGFGCLHQYGLVFDAWNLFTQLTELIDLARAFPGQTLVMNHIGGMLGIGPYAGKRDEVMQEWKRLIDAAAACPNIVVKLGGLYTPRCGFGWAGRDKPPSSAEAAAAFAPYYLYCIDKFGPDRCMFESNFPVDRASTSYPLAWNAFKRLTRAFSPAERSALLHVTAVRVYRRG